MLRTFIAVDLTEEIRSYLGALSMELNKYLSTGDVRWVKPENIHLTLKFLGDTETETLDLLGQSIDLSAQTVSPFRLVLGSLGCFPNPKRPRVIWVGFREDSSDLGTLQAGLEENTASLGWQPEKRKFHPHLTLGRVKNSSAVVRANLPWGREVSSHELFVKELSLYESKLKPTGAEYHRLHTSPLGTT